MDPTSEQHFFTSFNSYFVEGRFEDAEELVRLMMSQSVFSCPDNEDSYFYVNGELTSVSYSLMLCKALFYAGKYHTLTQEFSGNSFSSNHSVLTLHWYLYKAYMLLGQYDQALSIISLMCPFSDDLSLQMDQAICCFQLGELDTAEEMMRSSVLLQPNNAVVHNNLGNVLKEKGEWQAALEAYNRAASIASHFAEPHVGAGVVYMQLGDIDAAEQSFLTAIQLLPNHSLAHIHLAHLYSHSGKIGEAEKTWTSLIQQYPFEPEYYFSLVDLYQSIGQIESAVDVLESCLKSNPNNCIAEHLYQSLLENTTSAAPVEYIEELFNGYASHFDKHLLDELSYQTPERLFELWKTYSKDFSIQLGKVLDLGCGTGLSALPFKNEAASFTGVDLSKSMIEQAAFKGIYDELFVEEIESYIKTQSESFDSCLMVDVLGYIGDLSSIVSGIYKVLKPEGWLLFSTESSESEAYTLQKNGRYKHAQSYVSNLLNVYGFSLIKVRKEKIRKEKGVWVFGDLYIAQKM